MLVSALKTTCRDNSNVDVEPTDLSYNSLSFCPSTSHPQISASTIAVAKFSVISAIAIELLASAEGKFWRAE